MASSTQTLPRKQQLTQSLISLAQSDRLQPEQSIQTQTNLDAKDFFAKGTELYTQKNYEEARTAFDEALKLSPKFVEAYLNRGAIFLVLGKYAEAIEDFEVSLELKPDFADAWSNKGAVFEQLEKYEEALLAFDEAIKCQPENPEYWYSRGYSLLNLNRFAESIVAIERSIQLQGHNYDAWLNLGAAKVYLEYYRDAIDAFDEAITIDPNRPDAWVAKGLPLLYLKHCDDAITAYTQAIELKPELSMAWYNRACAYGLQSNAKEAIQDLEKAIILFSNWQEDAKTEPDFNLIRYHHEFQRLLGGTQDSSPVDQSATETSELANPWMKFAGMYENDSLFDDVLAEIEVYRRELDSELLDVDNEIGKKAG